MNLQRFGYLDDPFSEASDCRSIYLDAHRRRIQERIIGSIGQTSGFFVLAGEAGVGKTTMLHSLAEQLANRTDCYFLGATPWLTCKRDTTLRDLAKAFSYARCLGRLRAAGLQVASGSEQRDDDQRGFVSRQRELTGIRRVAVIILDDAHRLAPEVIAQLRRWRKAFESVRGPLLTLLTMRSSRYAQFGTCDSGFVEPGSEDIFTRLRPFTHGDVRQFIRHRLRAAGYDGDAIFPSKTVMRIFVHGKGNPAETVRLCRQALTLMGHGGGAVSAAVIDAAARNDCAAKPDTMADAAFLQIPPLAGPNLAGMSPAFGRAGQMSIETGRSRAPDRRLRERLGNAVPAGRLTSAAASIAVALAVVWFYRAAHDADRHPVAALGSTMFSGMSAIISLVRPEEALMASRVPAEGAPRVEAALRDQPAMVGANEDESAARRLDNHDWPVMGMTVADDDQASADLDVTAASGDPEIEAVEETAKPLAPESETPPATLPGVDDLLRRGNSLLEIGDIASARLFYEMAFDRGSAQGAMLMGLTFDPAYFERAGIYGARPQIYEAIDWYQRSSAMGNAEAEERLSALELWLRRSAQEGDEDARQALKLLINSPPR